MNRIKPLIVVAVVALLGAIAVFGAFAAGSGRSELTVPRANMGMAASFQAAPAAGKDASASLPFRNIRVNTDTGIEAQNEPYVAVNPSNARHIIVGANDWAAGNGRFEVTAYVSFDGGVSWAASNPYIDRNAGRLNAADPTVAFGADGKVYFGFIAMTPAPGAVAVSTSLDGGRTWSSQSWATSFASAADKPAIAQAGGKLYVFYQNQSLMSTVSANGGLSWSSATTIEAGGRNAAPVVSSNGNVHVFYNTANAIKVARPSGGRVTTVSNAVALQQRPTQYRAGIYPAAGVDRNGTFYVAWADGRNTATGNDILLSRSTDGVSWSAPARVNTDAGNADQLMPALSVGADGAVSVAWLDTRNDPARVNYDVYMARSGNGQVWAGNSRVSAVSSNPNNDPRMQGQLIGDYFAMASGDGGVYVVWTDTRNNNEDIYLAPVPSSNE
jgi:type II secretory pathway pseudopilin PulG